jgi:ssDNA-binding Zn-finger/Zn-ribbon topoisomerase 1
MNPTLEPCPQCKHGDLIERRNKRTGQPFYGCSRYPECKFAVADLARLAPSALVPSPTEPLTSLAADSDLASAIRELTEAIAALARRLGLGDYDGCSSSKS